MDKDELERAEEHIKIAGEIVTKAAERSKGDDCKELLKDAAVSLERAESDVSEFEEKKECDLN